MSRPSAEWAKLRRRLIGVVFLVVFALLVWLSLALYHKQFTPVAMVTLYTDSIGNEMHVGASVMVRGVQVGEVRQISADGRGARLVLAIQPGMVRNLPANVSAEMLPTTLFGERYVDLLLPARAAPARLANGSVIGQNRSHDAVEIEHVLNNLLPLLQASEPDKLSVTLTAIAQGLQGRGKELGRTLVQLSTFLHNYNPHLPALDTDIAELAGFARNLNQASPDLLQALTDFTVTAQTLVTQRASFSALYATVTTASNDIRAFLAANKSNIINLNADSVSTLQTLARYSPEFPCVLKDLVQFEPAVDKLLGKGTSQPGLHVQAIVVPPLGHNGVGNYLPGVDTPKYGDNLGPHCYPVPFPGITLNDGTTGGGLSGSSTGHTRASAAARLPARTRAARHATTRGATQHATTPHATTRGAAKAGQPAAAAGASTMALAGSPAEGELVRELTGMALGRSPATVPAWSSLLLAPLFRGTTVSLR